jgi:lipopolysaccharide export system permease protein
MIFSKIWERMLFFRALKFILFFLTAIYLVYVIIDLSAHSGRLFSSSSSLSTVFLYYLHHFMARLDLFLPLSLLLATISLLTSMNLHHEIVSLRMSGISLGKLSFPLFILALLLSISTYLNYEFAAPASLRYIEGFKEKHLHHHSKQTPSLKVALLKDGSKIVYQSFDAEKKELFDLFWIPSHSDLWHIKYLCLSSMEGRFADHLVRKKSDLLFEKKDSYEARYFPEISWPLDANEMLFTPKENRSLSSLLQQKTFLSKADEAATYTHLYYKLIIPLTSPLIVLGLIPFCVRFSKNLQIFFLTALSLFAFFVFITLMDACTILGENQVLRALFALFPMPFFLYFLFGWRFLKSNL